MERRRGLWSTLRSAAIYSKLQNILGAERARQIIVANHIHPTARSRVLDVGCGPCDFLPHLGDVIYTGVDHSEAYIEAARSRFGASGTFVCGDITDLALAHQQFDIVMAIGVLHHLDDPSVSKLMGHISQVLGPGGRFITFDGVRESGQHPIGRLLKELDRGRYIRTADDYLDLVKPTFADTRKTIYRNLARVPYSHLVIEAQREPRP